MSVKSYEKSAAAVTAHASRAATSPFNNLDKLANFSGSVGLWIQDSRMTARSQGLSLSTSYIFLFGAAALLVAVGLSFIFFFLGSTKFGFMSLCALLAGLAAIYISLDRAEHELGRSQSN